MIPYILSGLALLAAAISLIFTITEKKRNQKRNAAVMQYISRIEDEVREFGQWISRHEEENKKALESIGGTLKKIREDTNVIQNNLFADKEILFSVRKGFGEAWDRLERIDKDTCNLSQRAQALSDSIYGLCEKVGALEKGICPDYEAAKEAAKAVDDFNSGLSAILNFDPLGDARRKRENPMRELEDA